MEVQEEPPFVIGQLVYRIGYSGSWVVSSVQKEKISSCQWRWIIGVEDQWRGYCVWPADQFRLVEQVKREFSLSA